MNNKILVSKVRLSNTCPHFKSMQAACSHLQCSASTLKAKTKQAGMYYAKNLQTGATCSFDKQNHKVIITVELVMNIDIDKKLPQFRTLEDTAEYFGVTACAIKHRCAWFDWQPNSWVYIEHKDGRKAYYRRRND